MSAEFTRTSCATQYDWIIIGKQESARSGATRAGCVAEITRRAANIVSKEEVLISSSAIIQ